MPPPSFEAVAAHDYRTLMGALIERKLQLGVTCFELESLGDLPTGYASKLFTGRRTLGLVSIGKMLAALNVRLVVVPAGRSQRGLTALIGKAAQIRRLDENGKDIRRSEWGKRGHAKWMCLTTPAERRRNARLAGKASADARAARKAETMPALRLAAPAALAKLASAPPLQRARSLPKPNPPAGAGWSVESGF
jgi:hypothetical protein